MLNRLSPDNRANQKRRIEGTRRSLISILIVLGLAFSGLVVPTNRGTAVANSQDDKWKLLSEKIQGLLKQAGASTTSQVGPLSLKDVDKSGINVARAAQGGKGTEYFVLNVEFKDAASRIRQFGDNKSSQIPGAFVLTATDRFVDLFVREDAPYVALRQRDDVMRIEAVGSVIAPPPPISEVLSLESKAVPDKIVRGGFEGMTGKGVIVAIIDSGIDFRHPDFITYDAEGRPTSRLLYFWDTPTEYKQGRGSPAPFTFPNKTPIGTLYTRRQLTEALRKEASGVPSGIPLTDEDGHGTACAGIAAGNGNADKGTEGFKRAEVVGVAPDADIIGVRLGKYGLENGYVLNAASEWLDQVAGKTPLVVSCSFGGHWGGHDGQTVRERHLSQRFTPDKAGRAIVVAAGNEGRDPIHAEATFGDVKSAKLIRWEANSAGAILNIYFDRADEGLSIAPAANTPYKLLGSDFNRLTGQLKTTLQLPSGPGGLWLVNTSGAKTNAHLFLPSVGQYGPAAVFWSDVVSYSTLVGEPGTAANVITVGSYDWNDNFHSAGKPITLLEVCRSSDGARSPLEIGRISCYSSPGPTRLGVTKPEIVAPGEWYSSSYAKRVQRSWPYVDTTGHYAGMNGTSAATPYTAGVIALVFQKQPTLTFGELRKLMTTKASRDPFTGNLPNKQWGYGKLDVAAVQRIFAALN